MRFVQRYLPILDWLPAYSKDQLSGDMNAGAVTAIMLVPQGMAYAMLAGLPPEIGLYASVLPLILYAVFGSSRVLAVGPVALVSLMVASTINALPMTLAADQMAGVAGLLALMVGVISVGMGVFRLGFIVNFISHHVISGFTSAAALIIGFSQLKHLMGIDIPRSHNIFVILENAYAKLAVLNGVSLAIGVGAIVILFIFKTHLGRFLAATTLGPGLRETVTKAGPLVVVGLSTLIVYAFGLDVNGGVKIAGEIPQGFPPFLLPSLDMSIIPALLPSALLISFVGFIESVSVAKVLASRRRQKIDPDNELIGLGAANLGAALSGGYPVTGGFSRSSVNFQAGANTPLAAIITAVLVALTIMFFTPLFYYLPKTVLAAIIMVAVVTLIDIKAFEHAWIYSKSDAISLIGTFLAVLAVGIEKGLAFGVFITIAHYLWRASKPHVAIIGRVPNTEHFRNYLRHDVQCEKTITVARIDESLFFANVAWLETWVLNFIADNPDSEHMVLNCAGVNFIDGSALEVLERLEEQLANAGVTLHLCEVKGPVMDRLKKSNFIDRLGPQRIYLSTHEAMTALGCPM